MFRTKRHRIAALAAAAALAIGVAAARATSVRSMPVGELAGRSTLILAGTVSGEATRLAGGAGGRTLVVTDFDLRELVVAKGEAGTRNHVVSLPGGALHGRRQGIAGMPRLEPGRRYVLLLDPREPLCPILGWAQGLFAVETDGDGVPRVRFADGRPVGGIADGAAFPGGEGMEEREFLRALADAGRDSGFAPAGGEDGR